MITKLVLDNWRSHEHSEFEFENGTNVLVGAMGSGKTSAMDDICFALFGTFPALQARKLKLDQVIMSRPLKILPSYRLMLLIASCPCLQGRLLLLGCGDSPA